MADVHGDAVVVGSYPPVVGAARPSTPRPDRVNPAAVCARVARALYQHDRPVTDTETWGDLTEADRASYLRAAAAMLAVVRAELHTIAAGYAAVPAVRMAAIVADAADQITPATGGIPPAAAERPRRSVVYGLRQVVHVILQDVDSHGLGAVGPVFADPDDAERHSTMGDMEVHSRWVTPAGGDVDYTDPPPVVGAGRANIPRLDKATIGAVIRDELGCHEECEADPDDRHQPGHICHQYRDVIAALANLTPPPVVSTAGLLNPEHDPAGFRATLLAAAGNALMNRPGITPELAVQLGHAVHDVVYAMLAALRTQLLATAEEYLTYQRDAADYHTGHALRDVADRLAPDLTDPDRSP